MYHIHDSKPLIKAFERRPFQGAEPESAKFLCVNLDANFDRDIENSPIFPLVPEYLNDGVSFWKKYGVHHPFLLPEYTGDGRYFHESFASIGFTPEEAGDVSFVELLHVPTYGRSSLRAGDLNPEHLQRLNMAILGGRSRYIFVPGSIARLMRASGHFPWMPALPTDEGGPLKVWRTMDTKTVYWHYHCSVYGRYEATKREQLSAIGALRG
jgi:hypothetical protein